MKTPSTRAVQLHGASIYNIMAENAEEIYTHPPAFDEQTASFLKPIYEELSSDDLLQRCLGKNKDAGNCFMDSCVHV